MQTVRQALAEGAYAPDADGRVAVDGHVLEPGDYELRTRPREGFEAVDDGTFVVAIDTQLTPELELEGLARELVRFLQTTRKELGLDISDRIRPRTPPNPRGEELWAAHGEFVAREVLATSVEAGQGGETASRPTASRSRSASSARPDAGPDRGDRLRLRRVAARHREPLDDGRERRRRVARRRLGREPEGPPGRHLAGPHLADPGRVPRARRGGRGGHRRGDHGPLRGRPADPPIHPLAGVDSLLRSLGEREVPLAVASNTPARFTAAALGASGLPTEVFSSVVCAGDGLAPKPEPDVYLAACRELGLPPERCVAFEDSPTGAAAARAAGMRVVGVPSIAGQTFEADVVLGSLDGLAVDELLAGRLSALA